MDYKVGSLADLISGSSTKKFRSVDSGVKIVFQSEENVSSHKRKRNRDIDPYIQYEENPSPERKRRRNADTDSYHLEHKKKRRKENTVTGDNQISNEHLSKSFDNSSDHGNYLKKSVKQDVQDSRVSENVKNAEKRLRKKEKKNKIQHPLDEEKESRTIFVKNLPINFKKSKIRKIFNKYGPIQSVRFRCVALPDPRIPKKVAVIKGNFHPDRSNISAFICFESSETAIQALAANGMVISDHHILVDKAIQEKTHNQRKAVFLGNVPFGAEEDDLWKLFEGCGKILDIRIIRDRNTGIGKGFAYINFESPDAVELALNLNGVKLKERELRVSRASKKPKSSTVKPSSFKYTSGHKPSTPINGQKKKHHHSAQHGNAALSEGHQKLKPKFSDDSVKEKRAKSKKAKLYKNKSSNGANKKTFLESSFQGQTIFDVKKQKHKKKLSKDELKKRIVMKKLGVNSDLPLTNKKKLKH